MQKQIISYPSDNFYKLCDYLKQLKICDTLYSDMPFRHAFINLELINENNKKMFHHLYHVAGYFKINSNFDGGTPHTLEQSQEIKFDEVLEWFKSVEKKSNIVVLDFFSRTDF